MKKILICLSDFRQGGIPRCLQTLLMYIDSNKYQIDLLCLSKDGPYNGKMPNCKTLSNDYIISQLMVHTKKISTANFIKNIPALLLKIVGKLSYKLLEKDILSIRLRSFGKKLNPYDCAIAYAEGFPAVIVENVKSDNKLLWIHNDYAFEGARSGTQFTNFDCFNKICCVSKATQNSLVSRYPQYKEKTITIHNLINIDYILNQANIPLRDHLFDSSSNFVIISIGRICAQKRFYEIPHIANLLKQNNIKFKWYIIGNGQESEVKLVIDNITKYNVEKDVILLGERDNPYNYLKHSNLFVLTSLYESYPTVINEARVLGVPIVTVNIPSAYEMLTDNEAIITPLGNIAEAIQELYHNKRQYNSLKSATFDNKNAEILKSFYQLINNEF